MKLKKVLPITALLLVALVWGCNKDAGTSSDLKSSDLSSSNLKAAALPVDLGSAGNFVILSTAGITDVSPSAIVGDIGTSPIAGTAITATDGNICNEVVGLIYTVGPSGPACRTEDATLLGLAVGDMMLAYDAAALQAPTGLDYIEVGAGDISGMTLAPGVYKWSSSVVINSDVTLSGGPNDVWIFQIAGTLDIASCASCASASDAAGIKVILSGGAIAANVFWQVAGATTLGTYSTFNGTILDQKNIALQTGAVLNGRALAQTAVTLQMNAIGIFDTKKECEQFLKAEKTVFDAGQKAAKQSFDADQKAAKQTWQTENPNPTSDVKKAFEAEQKADKQAFELDQKTAKQAFEAQQKIDKAQCSMLQ